MSSKHFNDVKNSAKPKLPPLPAAAPANKKPSIYIGLPAHDSRVHTSYAMGMWDIARHDGRDYDLTFAKTSHGGITKARNDLAWRFLKGSQDYLLYTDGDLCPNHNHLAQLIARNVDIIGALYCHKRIDLAWSSRHLPEGKIADNLQEVAAMGFGFILIKRRVFEVMMEKMPELRFKETWSDGRNEWKYGFFQEQVGIDTEGGAKDPEWLTEDWFFTLNARKLGFKVHCENNFHLQHNEGGQSYPLQEMEVIADTLLSYRDGLQDGGKKAGDVMQNVLPGWADNMKPVEAVAAK